MHKPFQNLGTVILKDGTVKPVILKSSMIGSIVEPKSPPAIAKDHIQLSEYYRMQREGK